MLLCIFINSWFEAWSLYGKIGKLRKTPCVYILPRFFGRADSRVGCPHHKAPKWPLVEAVGLKLDRSSGIGLDGIRGSLRCTITSIP